MTSSSSSSGIPHEVGYWIYHERQEALLCGQHALNNLVQACVFSPGSLAEIAHQLDEMELTYMAQNNEGGIRSKDYLKRVAEGSGNVDPTGNFSIEVLRSALKAKYDLDLPNIGQEGSSAWGDVTEIEGFICNRQEHWFAIRKINGRYWNLNSMKSCPEIISHFQLATEIQGLQNSGYSVFCVPEGLPPPCTSKAQRSRGLPQYWWKEDDLVKGKGKDSISAATDPWRDVGSGMRLDGKSTTGPTDDFAGLTEEEMLQMALAASLEKDTVSEIDKDVPLTSEPPAGTPGSVRIQFRLPDGSRSVRRFLETDSVKMVYAFVQSKSHADSNGQNLDLRFGFPPTDLKSQRGKTIKEASLAGGAIQCRFV